MCNYHLAHVFAVPHTGKRTAFRWMRRPRHMRAKRAIVAAYGTLRGMCVPPSDYDEITRICERSWKAHRATRWRATYAP